MIEQEEVENKRKDSFDISSEPDDIKLFSPIPTRPVRTPPVIANDNNNKNFSQAQGILSNSSLNRDEFDSSQVDDDYDIENNDYSTHLIPQDDINSNNHNNNKPNNCAVRFFTVIKSALPVSFQNFINRNVGLMLVALSQVFGSGMNITTRLLETRTQPPFQAVQILFIRMLITSICCLLYMAINRIPNFLLGPKELRKLLVIRGCVGFFGVFGLYYSLQYLSLSDAIVITFLVPCVSGILAYFVLKEPFTIKDQISGFISLVGVTLIARPEFLFGSAASSDNNSSHSSATPKQRLIATAVALLGVLGASSAYTTIRKIGKRAFPLLTVNYYAMISTLISGLAILILPGQKFVFPATMIQWVLLISIGICGFLLQFLLTAGLQRERASRAVNMTYLQMFFAVAFDKIVWDTLPDTLSIIGSILILGSAIWLALCNNKSKSISESVEQNRETGQVLNGNISEQSFSPVINGQNIKMSQFHHNPQPSSISSSSTFSSINNKLHKKDDNDILDIKNNDELEGTPYFSDVSNDDIPLRGIK